MTKASTLISILAAGLVNLVSVSPPLLAQADQSTGSAANNLTYAVAWKQTAAEYRALYYQGFNIARLQLQIALASQQSSDEKPLAIIADVDDTLLLSTAYWGFLVEQQQDFFDDFVWDDWIRSNRTEASPGALAFLRYCEENNIEVFYVTSRDQGDDTFALALANLTNAGFPYADADHLTVLRESSDKQVIQDQIREDYNVAILLGDNLNDFSRQYYVTDIDQRAALVDASQAQFGTRHIIFPNPTDGHWIRAIFGESEPAPTEPNRQLLRDAATRAGPDDL